MAASLENSGIATYMAGIKAATAGRLGTVPPAVVTELAELALLVENTAGQSYQNGLSVIKSAAGIKTAASIQPVEFQHAAILSFVLGKYPVPSAFTGVTLARRPSDYKV
jgi:hypothetical protein